MTASNLTGKVVLVTAASEGLGFACAKRFATAGCAVAICARRKEILDEASHELQLISDRPVMAEVVDLTQASDITRLVTAVEEAFGGLDILIVNSGHIPYGSIEDFDDDEWQTAFELLLMSAVRLTRLAIPRMRRRGGGDIVFASSSTMRNPPPHLLLSSVMRLGVAGLAKTVARAVAGENIRVNVVAPGLFDTGRVEQRIDALMREERLPREKAIAEFAKEVPMNRVGVAEEFAELVEFIVSRRSAYMTGTTITIDGGEDPTIL
jgi:3-oxoacyl-[acyl-carrier protein] reductase